MTNNPVVSLVLHAHSPFVRHPETASPAQERWFFESLSETYIPLLETFDRLDRDLVPFRMGLVLSPILCHMLTDELLIERYLEYTQNQIRFGEEELRRRPGDPDALARYYHDRITEKMDYFTKRWGKNLLEGFDHYQKKGRVEILAAAATNAFLPFYTNYPEAVQAQFEVAISTYRGNFGKYPQGFWLPELGWKEELDYWLRSYNFSYTILDSHALPFARPAAEKGNYYPAKTPLGIAVFGRDFYAAQNLADLAGDPVFRYNRRDQGFELPPESVSSFLGPRGSRTGTGYKYWASGDGSGKVLYNPVLALEKAKEKARAFLDSLGSRLKSAADLMADDCAIGLCAFEADTFGRFWYEGHAFIEAVFREGSKRGPGFMTPSEYLSKPNTGNFQTLTPEFSSWGSNGYAETWLDASNDWMYNHVMRALERMVEIAERFPNNTGLKERALNQAAREILLVLSSDWPRMLYKQENMDYARNRIEGSLRNFTTIYEALGSNYISTEWLTQLERRHNIFPNINYRVFRRKR